MASKKLGPVGPSPAAAPASSWNGERTSVVDLLTEHNRSVSAGTFEPAMMASLPRERQLAEWERFFEIGARAAELPSWAAKPELVERDGSIVPTVGGTDLSVSAGMNGKVELRQAVDLMRSSRERPRSLSRDAMVRMAEASFGSGPFQGKSGPDGPSR